MKNQESKQSTIATKVGNITINNSKATGDIIGVMINENKDSLEILETLKENRSDIQDMKQMLKELTADSKELRKRGLKEEQVEHLKIKIDSLELTVDERKKIETAIEDGFIEPGDAHLSMKEFEVAADKVRKAKMEIDLKRKELQTLEDKIKRDIREDLIKQNDYDAAMAKVKEGVAEKELPLWIRECSRVFHELEALRRICIDFSEVFVPQWMETYASQVCKAYGVGEEFEKMIEARQKEKKGGGHGEQNVS